MKRKMPGNLPFQGKYIQSHKGFFPLLISLLLILGGSAGCKHKWDNQKSHSVNADSIDKSFINIADSINYGVVIKNRDTDDQWKEQWLSSFDRQEFIDFIFNAVYSGELQPYDYFNDEPMTVQQVKQLEKQEEFDRSKIGKIQFKERWYFDPNNLKMVKEVYSVMLAYEVYREDGNFRGYKPAFMVHLNHSISPGSEQ